VLTVLEPDLSQPWDSGHNLKNRHTLIRTIVWYLEAFRDDAAKTVILADGKPAVELSFRMELDEWPTGQDGWRWLQEEHPYTLCGHLDRLVEFAGGYYVMDRKTTGSTLGGYYFDGFNPDNQMTLYTLAGRIIFNTPVRGVIIDAAQIAVGFSRFDRGITYRTEDQLNEWMHDLGYWLSAAARYAERDYWPMNDKACNNYGGCQFRKICSKAPQVRESFLGKRLRAPRVESAGGEMMADKPFHEMTDDELRAELEIWEDRVDSASGWAAAYGSAKCPFEAIVRSSW
jgi:hypothetical protein